ncbi:MAG: C13 family peptidase [Bryobacteraceae bacterium]
MRRLLLLAAAAAVSAQATSFYLTVAGLGGEPEYEQRFSGWASDITKSLAGEAGAKVETLSGKEATKANILAKLSAIASQAKADDTLMVLFIGHGSYDDIDYKLNIPGQDISASELNDALSKIAARQAIVLTTAGSAGAIKSLQHDKRVIITATKAGGERNATIFARFWVEAFRDGSADTDKNQTLTALEAYKYAKTKTKDYFDTQKRLATEHSLLEDTGKGEGEGDPSTANGQGLVAGRFPLMHLGSATAIAATPAKQALLKRKDDLETSIDELKYRKASMDLPTYNKQLQGLILELAKVQASLDQ